jgi:hypothetical protein
VPDEPERKVKPVFHIERAPGEERQAPDGPETPVADGTTVLVRVDTESSMSERAVAERVRLVVGGTEVDGKGWVELPAGSVVALRAPELLVADYNEQFAFVSWAGRDIDGEQHPIAPDDADDPHNGEATWTVRPGITLLAVYNWHVSVDPAWGDMIRRGDVRRLWSRTAGKVWGWVSGVR